MEPTFKKEDRDILFLLHLSQLLNFVTGFGGLVAPIIIWLIKQDEVQNLDQQAKEVINFQITMFIAVLICIPLCFIFIGIFLLIGIGLVSIIVPIIQAINAKDGRPVHYPLTIRFIK